MISLAISAWSISAWSISSVAQGPTSVARTEAELQLRLASRTTVSLVGAQVRGAALSVAKNGEMSVAVDRRVDPERPVELTAADLPIDAVWRRLAEGAELGYATLGPVVYVGPPATARDLNTLAALRREDAARTSPTLKAKLLAVDATTCTAPCDARELWNRLAAEAGLKTVNPERMAFDLWPAVNWAPLPLVDRLTLIAVQFELTFRIDASARTITLEPLPREVVLERSYPAGAKPQETLARFRTLAPTAVVKQVGAKIGVVGKYEDHERLAGRGAQAKPVAAAPPGVQVYTLRIKETPFGELVRVFKEKHGFKITVDEAAIKAAGISLDMRIDIDVDKVTLERLLDQAGTPLGLKAQAVGDTVEITVRGK